jgi:hypothetical protein
MSLGGRLAQIRATEASDPARRAWSSAEEFGWGKEPEFSDAPLQAQNAKRAPSPRACFSRGERAGGVGQLAAGERITQVPCSKD